METEGANQAMTEEKKCETKEIEMRESEKKLKNGKKKKEEKRGITSFPFIKGKRA